MNKSYLLKALEAYILVSIILTFVMHFIPPRLQWLVALGLALLIFAYAAYASWSHTKVKTQVPGQASVYVFFGCISLLSAIYLMVKPASAPSLTMALSYLAGIFIGIGILWLIVNKLRVEGS